MSNELKPCPFCGEKPEMWSGTGEDGQPRFVVFCGNDDCLMQVETLDFIAEWAAVERWNARVGGNNALKPCPSCGHSAMAFVDEQGHEWAVCDNCRARSLVSYWNNREGLDELKPCPTCGSNVQKLYEIDGITYVTCEHTIHAFDEGDLEKAVQQWDKYAEAASRHTEMNIVVHDFKYLFERNCNK